MITRSVRMALVVSSVLTHSIGFADTGYPNRLGNPGFESMKAGTLTSWSGYSDVVLQPGAARSGKGCARLSVKRTRTASMRSNAKRMYYTVDARHRFSVWARGHGELRLGYDTCPQQPQGSPYTAYMWQQQWTALTGQWQRLAHDFTILDPQSARRINVCVELRGDGAEAYLDDASLDLAPAPTTDIALFPFHGMATKGQAIDLEIQATKDGRPLTSGNLTVYAQAPDGHVKSRNIEIGASGLTQYRWRAPVDVTLDPGAGVFYRFLVAHAQSGQARFCSIEIVGKEVYDAFESIANKVKFPKAPAHVLFIGDSLSDGQRGFNYADKVGFWLRKSSGPDVSYKNVGVGGDFITRVWQRLNREPRVYRLPAYEGIFEPVPTHVLIFLGHNDSKVNSKRGTTCVPKERFEEEMRLTIQKIKSDTNAEVIVMSSSSSAYEVISKNWPVWAKKRPHGFSKFGIPEVMEQFNAMMKRAAETTGVEYLDVYEPTKNHPDKPSLFTADGVHVNNKGNRFLALQILRYLAQE